LLKQVSTFYKEKDEAEWAAVERKVADLEAEVRSKENRV
jgi:hypothetical protein